MSRETKRSPGDVGLTRKTLKGIAILQELPPESLKALESACRWQEYRADDCIFDVDDPSREVFFLVRGAVRIVNYAATGRQVGFANYGEGSILGELSALDGGPRSATVLALERTVLAIADRTTFIDLLESHPKVTLSLMVHLAGVIRGMNDRVLDLSAASDVQRVYFELLRRAEPNPSGDGGWLIHHMPRHKDLAEQVGTTPETVIHAISQLMKSGLVKRRSGSLELLEKDRIQKLALTR